MGFQYPEPERIIEYNILVLRELQTKRADKPALLSHRKLVAALRASQEYEGGLHAKAAVLLTRLIQAHAFASGNRRTALLATKDFLLSNGGTIGIRNDVHDARTLQGIREGFYTQDEIATWLATGAIHAFKR